MFFACNIRKHTGIENFFRSSLSRITLTGMAVLFIISPALSHAATYYVDTAGNDSNSGTSTTAPWRTVAKVNGRTYSPGDFILFKRGQTWNETLIVSSSGASGKHITYGAYGTGNRPVFNGGNTRSHCVEANNKDYITFSNLDANDGATNGFYVHDGDSHDFLVEDCIARSAGDLGFLFKGTHNITLRRCEATTSYWNGFAMQTFTATYTAGPYLFEDCDSYNNGHVGYDFQCATTNQSNIVLRRCKARGNGQNGVYVDQESRRLTNMTIEYCEFSNNGRIGIIIDDGNSSTRTPPYADNITIDNCVCYGNGTNVQTPVVPGEGIRGYMQNSRIRNCIIYNNNVNYNNKTELYVTDGGGTPNTCDYTLIYSPSMSNPINWEGAQYTYSGFRNTGQNAHGLFVNPLFVSPSTGNYTLQATSPCINAGTNLGLTKDLAGNIVPVGGAPDMGAYEYGTATAPKPAISSVTIAPNTGWAKVGAAIVITVRSLNNTTGLTPSTAAINGKSVSLRDAGNGTYTGTYTVAEGDPDGRNVEATNITLTGSGGTSAPASSTGSTLAVDGHTPRIASVVLSPNSGVIYNGDTVTITVTALNNETGLIPSAATINGKSAALAEQGGGIYRGTYTVQSTDARGVNIAATNITLRDTAGNVSAAAASGSSTLSVGSVAQGPHFRPAYSNTGSSSSVILLTTVPVAINGAPLATDDEIGVFTPGGLCAGTGVWTGQNLTITIWGDDAEASGSQGFQDGEAYSFRIWDVSALAEYTATATFADGDGKFHVNDVRVLKGLTVGTVSQATIQIPLAAGWNMVSSNVIPANTLLSAVLGNAAGSISFIKNGAGQVYWPAYSIDQIGEWKATDGYMIKAASATTITITGVTAGPADITYLLAQGWNLVSFTGTDGASPATAFASLGSALRLAKDGSGGLYYPQLNINQIGTMRTGKGYWVNLYSPSALRYSGTLAKAALAAGDASTSGVFGNTGNNATLMIEKRLGILANGKTIQRGDEIRVYSPRGLLVGKGTWENANCAVTIWGDDSETTEIDGLQTGESPVIRVWNRETNREMEVKAVFAAGKSAFQTDSFLILDSLTGQNSVSQPQSFQLGQNYPNPFNPETHIAFELPVVSRVKLTVYNSLGQKVRTLVDQTLPAGSHSRVWNGRDENGLMSTSGVYFYTLEVGSFKETRKMTFTK